MTLKKTTYDSTPGAFPDAVTADTELIVDECRIELITEFSNCFEYMLATIVPDYGFPACQNVEIDIVTRVFIQRGWDDSWTICTLIDYSKDSRINLLASVRRSW